MNKKTNHISYYEVRWILVFQKIDTSATIAGTYKNLNIAATFLVATVF